jgi:hypothetical protein
MRLQVKRAGNGGDPSGNSLWATLTSGLLARRWLGRPAPRLAQLALQEGQPTLLYFRTRGCAVCDLIDMKVAAACHTGKVRLVIVDRYAKSDAPEDRAIYTQPGNLLDFGGPINRAYQIGVYPSLVLIDGAGVMVLKDIGGGQVPPEQFGDYLQGRFVEKLG